eukprot:CAMPEP_0178959030 /NCGR_PEP_ID=MMETSP0789-20121207/12016_1 /TAXON_ID=3005 /ORGANISM="Rhizosolenia setigera, Strain CCMP 1694" /LENGTH=134 /DNA_ID=CAMNT_0020641891 /DNA_START=73 /DNA_END=477 /DNA_ORIENTATION=+
MKIRCLPLLVLTVLFTTVQSQECDAGEGNKCEAADDCPVSRPQIIRCASEYMDLNKNNKLDRDELEHFIGELPWIARGILNILGSVDDIMKKCDYDQDGAIGMDYDMEQSKETCLASCFKRKAFKKAFFPDCDL